MMHLIRAALMAISKFAVTLTVWSLALSSGLQAQQFCVGDKGRTETTQRFNSYAAGEIASRPERFINGDHKFWKIQKNGQEIGAVFGTMHVPDPVATFLDSSVIAVFKSADDVLVESNITDFDRESFLENLRQINSRKMIIGYNKADKLNSDSQNALYNFGESRHVTPSKLSGMSVEELAAFLASPECMRFWYVLQKGYPLPDAQIQIWSRMLSKKLLEIEPFSELANSDLYSDQYQNLLLRMLPIYVRRSASATEIYQYKDEQYLEGKISNMVALDMSYLVDDENFGSVEEEYDIRIIKRNGVFVRKIDQTLRSGRYVFIAIGAAHLIGNAGVIEQLRRLGYTLLPGS